eukprot:g6568.t1
MSIEVQSLAINALTKRIQEEAKVLPDGILRVADFLNYRVDPVLMDDCGAILANKLSSKKPTKVLAGCSSQGLLPALATSRHLNIPVVFAYASVPNAWGSRETISATIQEARHGSTVQALKSICEQAGATFVGVGAIIHNRLLENCMNGFQMETLAQVSPSSSSSQPVTISPAVDDLALPEVVAADVLTERVMTDGVVLPGNLLKVYSFINHQVDTGLMDMCGQLLARVFAGFGIQKVLTAQTGGLPPAHAVATALRVPLVCISLDCKVVGDCEPLQSVNDTAMIDRVLECAQPATGYGMINATTFLNHVVDTKLMDQAASVLAKRFVDAKCSAVLTAEMSGVAPAMALARKLRVPLVCARRELSKVMVVRDDTVLVVDDILGNGATALAMQELCEQVGATVVGMGFLVEKVFQHGRGKILARRPQLEDGIVALTKILSMDDKGHPSLASPPSTY